MTISTVKSCDSDPDTNPSTPEVQQIAAIPQACSLKPTPKTQTIIREANDQLFTQDEWDDLSELHQQFNALKDENKSLKQKIKKLKRANKYLVNEVNLLKLKYGEEDLNLEVRETVLDDYDHHI